MKVTYKYNEDDLNLVSTDGSKVLYDGLHFIEATRGHGKQEVFNVTISNSDKK